MLFYARSNYKKCPYFLLSHCGRKVILFRAKATESLLVAFQGLFIPHAIKQAQRNNIYVKLNVKLLGGVGIS